MTRAHLEEDAGKTVYGGADSLAGSEFSLVDFNRAGGCLEPDCMMALASTSKAHTTVFDVWHNEDIVDGLVGGRLRSAVVCVSSGVPKARASQSQCCGAGVSASAVCWSQPQGGSAA